MREIDHPHLVRLVDVMASWNHVPHVQSDPPHVCIAMEYVADSEPLSSALRKQGPSLPLAMQVLPQLAAALGLMHKSGLVHRDVWSENVLVCERTGRAVLVDLGCAEYVGSEPAVNSKLNIPYMSPEAARGLPQATGDDCWAVGLLMTEILTGRFVAERLGRSDWPIHFNPQALADAIQEAVHLGGALLGRICAQLLDITASQRLSMVEVITQCQGQNVTNGGPTPPPRLALQPPPAPATVVPPQLPATIVATQPTQTQPRPCFPPRGGYPAPPGQAQSTLVPAASASHQPPMDGNVCLVPGQHVQYRPQAQGGARSAVIVGRLPKASAWQIQIEGGQVVADRKSVV